MIPYGYKIENGKIQINTSEQKKLLTFFERYISGESVPIAGRDLHLSPSTLRLTLMRSLYLGTDYYPQVIPLELFNAAQTAMRVRSRGGRKKRVARTVLTCFKYDPKPDTGDPVRRAYHSIVAITTETEPTTSTPDNHNS